MTDSSPKNSAKVAKSLETRLRDCDCHCQFLSEALERFHAEPVRYKQIAGELRVLLCKWGRNKPLLLDLMDELGVKHEMESRGPLPFHLVSDGENWVAKNRRSVPLRMYVDDVVVMALRDQEYTPNRLIRTIAQQDGSAHEDYEIESLIAREGTWFWVGNAPAWADMLSRIGGLALVAAAKLLVHAIEKRDFAPAYFQLRGQPA
jgi:hypothetical protein